MLVLMQCVAEAVMAKGLRGLVEMVPGGAFLYDVAGEAARRLKDRKRADELRQELLRAAEATNEEARQAAERVAREVAAGGSAEDRLTLELYLSQIPAAVRQSMRRAEDPSGRSLPVAFTINDADDLVRQLPARLPRFRPGDALPGKPGWQLTELLGTGGFGEVWLARNPSLSALKGAVKFGLDPRARDRLLRHEGGLVNRVMEQGKHPNVVQLLDAHLEGDAPWLMYEYVPGGDLTGLILGWQQLPPDERVRRTTAALRTLAAAVGHFHRLSPPLVHRDLKPSNILVEGVRGAGSGVSPGPSALTPHPLPLAPPQLKVADFGIGGVAAAAALAQESARRSSTGVLMSQLQGSYTPLYASPQQQRGEPPDPRDDVHALGVIGFQMLTGRLDATLGADYAKTLRRMGVPEPLTELLGDCAAHDPENRPRDAADLAERLAKLDTPPAAPAADSTAVVPCPQCQTPLRVARDETRAVRCAKCGHTFRPFPAAAPPPVAAVPRAVPVARPADPLKAADPPRREPDPESDEDERRPRPARARPQASKVQQADEVLARGRRGIRTALLFVAVPVLLLFVVGGVALFFTRLIGGGARFFPVKKGEQVTVEKRLTLKDVVAPPLELAYSPDGRRLMTVAESGAVQLWDAESGEAVAALPPGPAGRRAVVSPDGTRVAAPGQDDRVQLFDIAKKANTPLPGLVSQATAVAYSPDGRTVAAGSEDGKVFAWPVRPEVGNPAELRDEANPTQKQAVVAVVFEPKGRFLATAGGSEVRLWKSDGWAPVRKLTAGERVTALAFTPDGKYLVAGCSDGRARTWHEWTGWAVQPQNDNDVLKEIDPQQGEITRVVTSPDNRRVFSLDAAGVGCLWEVGSVGPQKPIAGEGRTAAGAFSPDGKLFATAGSDGVVYIREMHFVELRVKAFTHTQPVRALAWQPQGKRLASIDEVGNVVVWNVPEMRPGGAGKPDEVHEEGQ